MTTTTTSTGGSTTTTTSVPIVEPEREEEIDATPQADIPLAEDEEGETVLQVSLPVGVGVTAQEVTGTSAGTLRDLLIAASNPRIDEEQVFDEILQAGIDAYVPTVQNEQEVTVRTVVFESNGSVPTQPIRVTGATGTGESDAQNPNRQEALVIDVSNLPSGTVIEFDKVEFAIIIGAVSVSGGEGRNFVVADDDNQYIVLGEDDDVLRGGGGKDTVGSLGGADQLFGDAGNDTVFGGSGNDSLSGGSGEDKLNGGLGIDTALLSGNRADYSIELIGNGQVNLTQQTSGETTRLWDVERLQFDQGDSLTLAHSANEALGQHLIGTWLGRDPTTAEAEAIQNWQGEGQAIIDAFLRYLAPESVQALSQEELLAGLADNPNILRLDAIRAVTGSPGDDRAELPTGLGLSIDGSGGHDVLGLNAPRSNLHLEAKNGQLELTRLDDGSMYLLSNIEMLGFSNGDTLVLAHNGVEAIIARLYQGFLGRNATEAEWSAERAYIHSDQADANDLLARFQQQANTANLDDAGYIQQLIQNTLGRAATTAELSTYQTKLTDGSLDRGWLAVELAASEEAAAAITGVMQFDGWV
ncbi:MAG: DUF4214 domain-containing protein [Gammaproteobacteria bacterium SHHR-1]